MHIPGYEVQQGNKSPRNSVRTVHLVTLLTFFLPNSQSALFMIKITFTVPLL